MSQATRKKNSDMAAMLKKLGVRRTSGTCPMGCGALITNGGQALIFHLGRCRGKRR